MTHPVLQDVRPDVKAFFDTATFTASYVVSDPTTKRAAVIDSVLDFDPASGRTSHASADEIIAHVRAEGLTVDWVLETHVHADHLSAAPYVQAELGGRIGIGAGIVTVQETFAKIFNESSDFPRDGSQFDALFHDEDHFEIGKMEVRVLHTPGHTPADITYVIGDAAFVGDTIFMPDFGTARTDFPGGSAKALFASIGKLFTLPDETRVFVGHDYKAPGRDSYAWETTIGAQKADNVHVGGDTDEADFIEMREARDATLAMPRLILPSLQVNMRAGQLPPAEDDGHVFFKIPVNTF